MMCAFFTRQFSLFLIASGIAAVVILVRDGYSPVVFEADNRVGGMTATFDTPA